MKNILRNCLNQSACCVSAINQGFTRRWLLLTICVLTNLFATSQGWAQPGPCNNIVLNYSFEDGTGTPDFIANIYPQNPSSAAIQPLSWFRSSEYGTPDWFRNDCVNGNAGVPYNDWTRSNKPAPARTGGGYAGVFSTYFNSPAHIDFREYLRQPLATALVSGRHYYAECWSLAATETTGTIEQLGMNFTINDPYEPASGSPLGGGVIIPTVNTHSGDIRSYRVWTRTAGCFTAQGGESFVAIGNFREDQDMGFQAWSPPYTTRFTGGYQFIDDVVLQPFPEIVSVCVNGQQVLRADCALTNGSQATYTWTPPNAPSTMPSSTVPPFTATVSGLYSLTTTVPGIGGASDHTYTATLQVTVPTLVVTISASPNPFCLGETVRLTATPIADATYQLQDLTNSTSTAFASTNTWPVTPTGVTT